MDIVPTDSEMSLQVREEDMSRGFGVYVHIPYCAHRCSYCEFFSTTDYSRSDFASIVSRIREEIFAAGRWCGEERLSLGRLQSIFFGGGTPSLIPPALIQSVIDAIFEVFGGAQEHIEITLEANPETIDRATCQAMRCSTAINRVSIGVQSFDQHFLALLDRRTSAAATVTAVKLLQQAGYDNLNLDLIFGIPGQTKQNLYDDLCRAIDLDPKHISFYNLTLKPAHRLYRALPDSDAVADLYTYGVDIMRSAGLVRYEISNFSQAGYRGQHNLLYWSGGSFLGFGPSSASRIFKEGVCWHRKQKAALESYLGSSDSLEFKFEPISKYQTALEAVFLELRKSDGVDLDQFEQRYGYDLKAGAKFDQFLRAGLIQLDADRLSLTDKGLLLADGITPDLLPDWVPD